MRWEFSTNAFVHSMVSVCPLSHAKADQSRCFSMPKNGPWRTHQQFQETRVGISVFFVSAGTLRQKPPVPQRILLGFWIDGHVRREYHRLPKPGRQVQCGAATSTGKSGFPNRILGCYYMVHRSVALQGRPRCEYTTAIIFGASLTNSGRPQAAALPANGA